MKFLRKIGEYYYKFETHGLRKILKYVTISLYSYFWAIPVRRSYSQKGEDLVIDKLLNYKKRGIYIDIGAHDPSLRNNTKRFYQKGWKGINIEPDFVNFKKFIKVRPRDINLNIGISKKNSVLNFYRFDPDTISTFSKENLNEYQRYGFKLKDIIKIKTKKLSNILSKYMKSKKIDFFSIDAEGYDLQVLKSNNWDKFRPTLICIEAHYHYNKKNIFEETKDINKFLTKVGYKKVWSNNINEIYLREN